jgi:S-DNA-T family DNA segregation ATPase FtsK/SpoIIIE
VPTYPDGSRIEENRLTLWKALETAGPTGLTKPEAVKQGICNHHTTINPWLAQWVRSGWVEENGKRDRGVVYVLTAAHHTPAPAPDAADTSKETASCPASM